MTKKGWLNRKVYKVLQCWFCYYFKMTIKIVAGCETIITKDSIKIEDNIVKQVTEQVMVYPKKVVSSEKVSVIDILK